MSLLKLRLSLYFVTMCHLVIICHIYYNFFAVRQCHITFLSFQRQKSVDEILPKNVTGGAPRFRDNDTWSCHHKNLLLTPWYLWQNFTCHIVATMALERFHIVTQSRFRKKSFYVKLTTFSTAKETASDTKWIIFSKSISKIKVTSPWRVFVILPTSAVICV